MKNQQIIQRQSHVIAHIARKDGLGTIQGHSGQADGLYRGSVRIDNRERNQKKGGIMSIMHALADSLWQEISAFVNAFLVVYRAEIT